MHHRRPTAACRSSWPRIAHRHALPGGRSSACAQGAIGMFYDACWQPDPLRCHLARKRAEEGSAVALPSSAVSHGCAQQTRAATSLRKVSGLELRQHIVRVKRYALQVAGKTRHSLVDDEVDHRHLILEDSLGLFVQLGTLVLVHR